MAPGADDDRLAVGERVGQGDVAVGVDDAERAEARGELALPLRGPGERLPDAFDFDGPVLHPVLLPPR
ncbi:hypothetical protein [Tepidiforma sp.]|uniref:hypothetical protein n=1 Tax=Tepidiforma sp. TaxID=2682230 RepID=UPI0025871BF4|nr:hypothetical protein [Tepidiforma sp.]